MVMPFSFAIAMEVLLKKKRLMNGALQKIQTCRGDVEAK
jgi:hypothetical protein